MEGEDDRSLSSWAVLWPAYLDGTRTAAQGRKVPKNHSVDAPTLDEISKALAVVGVATAFEGKKSYPRDATLVGRFRVDLFGPKGDALHESIPSRKVLFSKVAEQIKTSRTKAQSGTSDKEQRKKGKRKK
jgi:signal recognition particle subunit SEC65